MSEKIFGKIESDILKRNSILNEDFDSKFNDLAFLRLGDLPISLK